MFLGLPRLREKATVEKATFGAQLSLCAIGATWGLCIAGASTLICDVGSKVVVAGLLSHSPRFRPVARRHSTVVGVGITQEPQGSQGVGLLLSCPPAERIRAHRCAYMLGRASNSASAAAEWVFVSSHHSAAWRLASNRIAQLAYPRCSIPVARNALHARAKQVIRTMGTDEEVQYISPLPLALAMIDLWGRPTECWYGCRAVSGVGPWAVPCPHPRLCMYVCMYSKVEPMPMENSRGR